MIRGPGHRNNIKTIQMEELVPLDARQFKDRSLVMNRYVHAQWSPSQERFVHFDGAVRVYEKDRYFHRLYSDLKHHTEDTKADQYHKLFRVDCPLTLDEWCQLVACFYYPNELAIEYLGGPQSSPNATGAP